MLVADGLGDQVDVARLAKDPAPLLSDAAPGRRCDPLFEGESHFHVSDDGFRILARRLSTYQPYRWEAEDVSVGRFYSYASKRIFGSRHDAGKVMGLAAFGDAGRLPDAVELSADRLRFPPEWLRRHVPEPGNAYWRHRDLAARVQTDAERALRFHWQRLRESSGSSNICVAGGVGLNCSANGVLKGESIFDRHFFFPASGDDGIAIGAALYGHNAILGGARHRSELFMPYLGMDHGEAGLVRALAAVDDVEAFGDRHALAQAVATEIAAGHVLGLFQGRSEFGPRALGNRSIIASPRSATMREYINAVVKQREFFRPLAPVVRQRNVARYFDVPAAFESPHMMAAVRVRRGWRDALQAVTHVDGTARVQTVTDAVNPLLCAILDALEQCGEPPVLLNTSFNGKGRPIVETPDQAVQALTGLRLDGLIVGQHLVRRRYAH